MCPADLFSVNATTAASVAGLFARNERVICLFENGSLTYALILVGALFVGSMETVWHGEITPRRPREPSDLPVQRLQPVLAAWLGDGPLQHGLDGHSAIAARALPPGCLEFVAGSAVRVGQAIARLS